MTETEVNLLSTLPFSYISDVLDPTEDYTTELQLKNVLSNDHIHILDDICITLCNVNNDKWQNASRTSLFLVYLLIKTN